MNSTKISTKVLGGLLVSAILLALMPLYVSFADAKTMMKGSKASVDLTCMQTAIDTREGSIITAFSDFNDDLEAALTVRKTALHDAWGLSEKTERDAAVREAWAAWKEAKKAAHNDLKSARKAVWTAFKNTAKTSCKETLPKEEVLEKDAAGTVSL